MTLELPDELDGPERGEELGEFEEEESPNTAVVDICERRGCVGVGDLVGAEVGRYASLLVGLLSRRI
jgi:hypothetical protein